MQNNINKNEINLVKNKSNQEIKNEINLVKNKSNQEIKNENQKVKNENQEIKNKSNQEIKNENQEVKNENQEVKKVVYRRLFNPEFHKILSINLKNMGLPPIDNPLLTPEYYEGLRRRRLLIQSLPYEKIKRKWWYFSDRQVWKFLKYCMYFYIIYRIYMWWKGTN